MKDEGKGFLVSPRSTVRLAPEGMADTNDIKGFVCNG